MNVRPRSDLVKHLYRLVGYWQLEVAKNNTEKIIVLEKEIGELRSYLSNLDELPESKDYIQEMHLRFLARMKLALIAEYRIVSYIGAGQCGVVYKSIHTESNVNCALKVLFYPRNEEEKSRFINEGEILHKLSHPSIVKGIEATQELEEIPINYYSMELIEDAISFERFIEKEDLVEQIRVLKIVCDGLAYAHEQYVIHRDLHLQNILIRKSGMPVILDFGSAKNVVDNLTFKPVGNLKTASPEKIVDSASVDGKSDVFSIGCILYYILEKRWPFYSNNYGEFINRILSCKYEKLKHSDKRLRDLTESILIVNSDNRPKASELSLILGN